ncbi:unnamed protein product, partial [Ectocarpus sp. 8 AP-2014]
RTTHSASFHTPPTTRRPTLPQGVLSIASRKLRECSRRNLQQKVYVLIGQTTRDKRSPTHGDFARGHHASPCGRRCCWDTAAERPGQHVHGYRYLIQPCPELLQPGPALHVHIQVRLRRREPARRPQRGPVVRHVRVGPRPGLRPEPQRRAGDVPRALVPCQRAPGVSGGAAGAGAASLGGERGRKKQQRRRRGGGGGGRGCCSVGARFGGRGGGAR